MALRRLPARFQRVELGGDDGIPRVEAQHLLAIERELLLPSVDVELSRVRRFAGPRRRRFGFDELDAKAGEIGFDLRHARGGDRLALAGAGEIRARRFDRLRQLPVLPREEHLLPAAQLVAQLPVAARLRRLALQRAALLLHFKDDVVDAREILLRRFELQLRGASARFVFGNTRGFFDQLAPIRRTRTQDQPDLALLDDRVCLRAEPCVHQQIVDVAQPADPAVDQVFALAGPVQTARDFDFARDRLDDRVGRRRERRREAELDAVRRRRRQRHGGLVPVRARVVAVPVSVAVAVCVAVAVPVMPVIVVLVVLGVVGVVARRGVHHRQRRLGDLLHEAAETQPHFGGRRRLARVAAAEDDVFHPLATQALGALLAHDPRDGVGDVALAAPVRPDDGRHALVEGEFGAVGKRLESVDFQALQAHPLPIADCGLRTADRRVHTQPVRTSQS